MTVHQQSLRRYHGLDTILIGLQTCRPFGRTCRCIRSRVPPGADIMDNDDEGGTFISRMWVANSCIQAMEFNHESRLVCRSKGPRKLIISCSHIFLSTSSTSMTRRLDGLLDRMDSHTSDAGGPTKVSKEEQEEEEKERGADASSSVLDDHGEEIGSSRALQKALSPRTMRFHSFM